MPEISTEIQDTLWKIGDALAQALANTGDPSWRVTGLGSKAWKISHPELPVVKDDQGVQKDVLLQMHLQEDEDSDRWFVIAQNKVVSPEAHSSPRLFIVADKDTPPSDSWSTEDAFGGGRPIVSVERSRGTTPPEVFTALWNQLPSIHIPESQPTVLEVVTEEGNEILLVDRLANNVSQGIAVFLKPVGSNQQRIQAFSSQSVFQEGPESRMG